VIALTPWTSTLDPEEIWERQVTQDHEDLLGHKDVVDLWVPQELGELKD
jgi:hypothetical protein